MNINLDSFSDFLIPKLLFIVSNFIDDLCCLLLSHLGIHLSWLSLVSSLLISCKILYFAVNWIINNDKTSKLQKA